MKKPCRITVRSERQLAALELFSPREEKDCEEWEEMLWEEGLDVSDDKLYTDRKQEMSPEGAIPSADTTLTARGLFSLEEDGTYRVSYEDSEITGLEGCLTTFCHTPSGMLIMLRRGPVKTCMVFEKGHRHLCDYGAAGGVPSVFLHTHALRADLNEQGGRIRVDYSVEIRGSRTERNTLDVSVRVD